MSQPQDKNTSANPMWGGHFNRGPAEIMAEINASIDTDKRMFRQDIAGSRAHVRMLAAQKIVSEGDRDAILQGLEQVERELEAGTLPFNKALEDIHMHVEARLKEIIGTSAGRLHTARSRNDQVATDFRLYSRDALQTVSDAIKELQSALVAQAETHAASVMPGFTHLQIAQPITFGHHMLAYVEMLERDRGRLQDAKTRLNQCPLGAAALAGTSFPIDRQATAKELGFDGVMGNSLDAVSDRDFVLESLSAASILMVHLSRLAEELIMWMSPAFSFVSLSHGYTTGSSIMPQKRNPDAAELVRGKAGGVFGTLQGMLTMMKALPLTYSKDMQEDKAPFFEVLDTLALCLPAMRGMITDMTVHPDAMLELARKGFSTATDLADWLVRELDMPFRDAHHVTGRMVCAAEERNCRLDELPLEVMQEIEPKITNSVMQVLDVTQAVHSRTSEGGTAPKRVQERAAYWQGHLS